MSSYSYFQSNRINPDRRPIVLDRRVEKLNCTLSASASKVIHIEERKLLESSLSSRCVYVGVRVKAYVEINFHASKRLEFIFTIFSSR